MCLSVSLLGGGIGAGRCDLQLKRWASNDATADGAGDIPSVVRRKGGELGSWGSMAGIDVFGRIWTRSITLLVRDACHIVEDCSSL